MEQRAHLWIGLLLGCLMILHCATGMQTLKAPTGEQSFLVIGSIIFQSNYLGYKAEVLRSDIEVAVMGRIEEKGEVKITGYWTMTDRNGYFFLADVPPGQYVVKGVRLTLSDGTRLVISSPLRQPGDLGFQRQDTESIIFTGNYFPHHPRGRIMNLEHNYFTIDRTMRIGHTTQQSVQDLELVTGERIDLPRVQDHFIEKYPDSEWIPFLKDSLR